MRNRANQKISAIHKPGKRGYNRPLASTVDHCTVGTRESLYLQYKSDNYR